MIAVYALSCENAPDDIYIGSSKNVKDRMATHKCDCNNIDNELKVYQFIRSHGGWEKWQYHIIEEFDVYDKKELKKREDYWMLELKSTLNSRRANRSQKEYDYDRYHNNREAERARSKKWTDNNKARVKATKKKYNKKYAEENKAKLTARNYCECGSFYQYKSRHEHFRTKKCRNYMASIISI